MGHSSGDHFQGRNVALRRVLQSMYGINCGENALFEINNINIPESKMVLFSCILLVKR